MRTLPNHPLRALRLGLHLLVLALLAIVVVRALQDDAPASAVVGCALVMATLYAVGAALLQGLPSRRWAPWVWLASVGGLWLVLLALTADGIWLAFPLFFLALHTLPRVAGLLAVAGTTAAAIAAYAWHDSLTPASVIGPVLGAGVAVATVLGYEALMRESEERRRLIDELVTTRDALARSQHAAGVVAERERLAREIHDTLAQGLTSIQLLLRAAERALPGEPSTALRHIEQARVTAGENLGEARSFVRALPPPGLEDASLAQALSRLCEGAGTAGDVQVSFSLSGDERHLPQSVAGAVLRIAQSAVANAVQHSGSSAVGVTLSYMEDEVALDVVDNGRGFAEAAPAEASGRGHGFGLSVMRARAIAAGGILSVESAPGEGTAVVATFPDLVQGPE